jgi:hypothetical protein
LIPATVRAIRLHAEGGIFPAAPPGQPQLRLRSGVFGARRSPERSGLHSHIDGSLVGICPFRAHLGQLGAEKRACFLGLSDRIPIPSLSCEQLYPPWESDGFRLTLCGSYREIKNLIWPGVIRGSYRCVGRCA